MAVHIIVDGYNLIRRSRKLAVFDRQDIEYGRKMLIDMLATYKKLKKHKITVVFDGIDAISTTNRKSQVKGVQVQFSRPGESADTVIKRMAAVEMEKAMIVTSDRDIQGFAESRGASVIDATVFEEKICIAGYMDTKGVGEESLHEGWTPDRRKKGPSRRLSKKRRRHLRKVDKL